MCLCCQCGNEIGIGMVECIDGDVGVEIDVFVFFGVLYLGIFVMVEYQVVWFVDWQLVVFVEVD